MVLRNKVCSDVNRWQVALPSFALPHKQLRCTWQLLWRGYMKLIIDIIEVISWIPFLCSWVGSTSLISSGSLPQAAAAVWRWPLPCPLHIQTAVGAGEMDTWGTSDAGVPFSHHRDAAIEVAPGFLAQSQLAISCTTRASKNEKHVVFHIYNTIPFSMSLLHFSPLLSHLSQHPSAVPSQNRPKHRQSLQMACQENSPRDCYTEPDRCEVSQTCPSHPVVAVSVLGSPAAARPTQYN